MAKVAIFGTQGMLGKTLVDVIGQSHDVIEFNRKGSKSKYSKESHKLDAEKIDVKSLRELIQDVDYLFNSIAIVKQRIPRKVSSEFLSSVIAVNSNFPCLLEQTVNPRTKIIEIGTDCVFSGRRGSYNESDLKDPTDVYGWSKTLGEVESRKVMRIRTSIIGRQNDHQSSLLDWFLNKESNVQIPGFTNHFWNGMTTLHFSKIVLGVINEDLFQAGTYHFYSKTKVSKGELLNLFRKYFDRSDIEVKMIANDEYIDRSLETNFTETNSSIWRAAGYKYIPHIEDMLQEFAHSNKVEG